MSALPVENIAPFINKTFTVTSAWWVERWGTIHKGLDIATGGNDPVYSMLDGFVLDKGGSPDTSTGYYIIIANGDINSGLYGFATRYLHLAEPSRLNEGDRVQVGQQVGIEGETGTGVTGIHLHVEMQNVALNTPRFTWKFSDQKSDYIDPTRFMSIDNEEGTEWYYNGTPIPYPPIENEYVKDTFNWVCFNRRIKKRRKL